MKQQIGEWEGNELNPFLKVGNRPGMKNSIPKIRDRESTAFIRGNGRERDFPLATAEQQFNAFLINHQLTNSFLCDMKRRRATMLFVFAPWRYNKRIGTHLDFEKIFLKW